MLQALVAIVLSGSWSDEIPRLPLSLGEVPREEIEPAESPFPEPGPLEGGDQVPPPEPRFSPNGLKQADPRKFPSPHDSFDGFFETHFSSRAWKEYVGEDYLIQPAVLLPVGLAASAAAISHWDRPLERHWQGLLGGREAYGNVGQYSLVGAVILIGAALPGEGRNWWDEWCTIGEAYIAASATTFVVKSEVKRPRPGSVPGTGNGTHSFPSGHATSSFTAATLIEANSGPALGLPAYGLAAFTAFERVEAGRHYPSDVLAGAAIGSLSAGIFDALHWGADGKGGIARPPIQGSVSMEGHRAFEVGITTGF